MKKGTFIALGIAFALAIVFEIWHINTTLQNRARLKAVEAHVKAAHTSFADTMTMKTDGGEYQLLTK